MADAAGEAGPHHCQALRHPLVGVFHTIVVDVAGVIARTIK
eukprot:CAMPEP_0180659262 /NCGR_PEP_ID=MMETSP1037_2-20121125/57479_1 /TAXON_ID=632150 /ORGANISM="Azadinium spinosum, Strain 3D9" /LENGTH=40 /DNA_ID= /DNA_START= /DNA_END= /DNA_ORIENTATION=